MKTLYIECAMGAAGDMLAAALLELLPDRAAFLAKMNGLGIPGVTVSGEKSVKCGVAGTHFSVKVAGIELLELHVSAQRVLIQDTRFFLPVLMAATLKMYSWKILR